MSIVIVKGPAQSGKSVIANALRNNQIAFKKGALLVDEQTEGDATPLLEKILAGKALQPGVAASEQPWKPDTTVILVGERASMLEQFEELAPGFTKLHGPVYTVVTAKA